MGEKNVAACHRLDNFAMPPLAKIFISWKEPLTLEQTIYLPLYVMSQNASLFEKSATFENSFNVEQSCGGFPAFLSFVDWIIF